MYRWAKSEVQPWTFRNLKVFLYKGHVFLPSFVRSFLFVTPSFERTDGRVEKQLHAAQGYDCQLLWQYHKNNGFCNKYAWVKSQKSSGTWERLDAWGREWHQISFRNDAVTVFLNWKLRIGSWEFRSRVLQIWKCLAGEKLKYISAVKENLF